MSTADGDRGGAGALGEAERAQLRDDCWGAGDDANAYDLDWLIDQMEIRLDATVAAERERVTAQARWIRECFAESLWARSQREGWASTSLRAALNDTYPPDQVDES